MSKGLLTRVAGHSGAAVIRVPGHAVFAPKPPQDHSGTVRTHAVLRACASPKLLNDDPSKCDLAIVNPKDFSVIIKLNRL